MSARLLCGALAVMMLPLFVTDVAFAQSTGEPYTIRSWDDVIKLEDGTQATVHTVVSYDPASHTYTQDVYDSAGSLLENSVIEGSVTPSPAEEEAAREVIRNDAEFSEIANRAGIRLEGGYILHTDECANTRCLQFEIADFGSARVYSFVVVDLAAQRIMHRNYHPHLVTD